MVSWLPLGAKWRSCTPRSSLHRKKQNKKASGFQWLTERAAFKQRFNKLTSKLSPEHLRGEGSKFIRGPLSLGNPDDKLFHTFSHATKYNLPHPPSHILPTLSFHIRCLLILWFDDAFGVKNTTYFSILLSLFTGLCNIVQLQCLQGSIILIFLNYSGLDLSDAQYVCWFDRFQFWSILDIICACFL